MVQLCSVSHARDLLAWLRADFLFFFFNDTATTEIYTLSLHDALPISASRRASPTCRAASRSEPSSRSRPRDRKSTRLNSSHGYISYAVFCLKKKKGATPRPRPRPRSCVPASVADAGRGQACRDCEGGG